MQTPKHLTALALHPTMQQILAARLGAGLTQTQAGLSLFRTLRTWQNWEAGVRPMPPDSFALFMLLHDQIPLELVREASTHSIGPRFQRPVKVADALA